MNQAIRDAEWRALFVVSNMLEVWQKSDDIDDETNRTFATAIRYIERSMDARETEITIDRGKFKTELDPA